MSWQLGAFTILALALAGGFAWYERGRPDARIVALVATLAALAALGRIAFAAVPNVKPTTDIVLISGYTLGGAPGFAVGALAGLTSNFFFGQGPWTPWQMAAWGATGMIGAGLAIITRRHIGRWSLAAVCGVVGFGFTAMQDVGDWVTYSDHSAGQLGIYVGKGVGFDLIHAAGCVAFALLFGPALIHAIERFARRIEINWQPVATMLLPAIAIVAVLAGVPSARAGGSPVGYMKSAQNRDGGYGSSPGVSSSELYTGWAALGLAAEGVNPQNVRRGGHSVIDYMRAGMGQVTDPGSLERTILAVRAAGISARNFAGRNLLTRLQHDIRSNGSVANQVNWTSFAILALRSAGATPPGRSYSWLTHQQNRDGGFSFAAAGAGSDVDDTAAALEALAGNGGAGSVRQRAVTFIRRHQNRDGGFPLEAGGTSNAQSTAWAVQGLIAAGVNPATLHRSGSASPLAYLRSLTGPDGHVHYSRTSDQTPVWVTAEAMMALAGKPLPLQPRSGGGRATPVQRSARTTSTARHKAAAAAAANARRARARGRHRHHTAVAATSAAAMSEALIPDAAVVLAVALAPVGLGPS
jgi:energy-coupling factor transport system substrate-specific component